MSKLTIALFVAAGLASAGPAAAQISAPKTTSTSTPMSKDSYNTAKHNADALKILDAILKEKKGDLVVGVLPFSYDAELNDLSGEELRRLRRAKFRSIGIFA